MKILPVLLFVCFVSVLSSGCSTKFFNGGYEEDFTECPGHETGGCSSVEDAHNSAVKAQRNKEKANIKKYSGGEYDGAFDDAYGQKPLPILLEELQKCIEKEDKECIKTKKEAIEFHNRFAEDRAAAKNKYQSEMKEESMKFSAFAQEAYGGNRPRPVRTGDSMMELTMLPYETESGALASSRTFWFVVEEGQWSWGTLTNPKKEFRGRIGGLQ
jgi:type IV conjugative transfer system lipoprotein TraV